MSARARLAGLLLLPAVLVLGGCGLVGGGDTYRVSVVFDRAVSLYPESQVLVLGLPVGTVRSVEPHGREVHVELDIDAGIPLPADVHASLLPRSLIGERTVQLFPAWTEGDPRLPEGGSIPVERTVVPVEPDEALEAARDFLQSLDPDGAGRLVENLAGDLEGTGADLNRALESLSGLASTFAAKSGELVAIVENLDRLTATLVTREAQLGRVLDDFAQATAALARERQAIEELVAGLARVSTDGLDLVSAHAAELDRGLDVVGRTLRSAVANLDSVRDLLDAGPLLATGLDGAYNPEYRRLDLRPNLSPVVTDSLNRALEPLGIDLSELCVPADVECPDAELPVPLGTGGALGAAPDAAGAVGAGARGAGPDARAVPAALTARHAPAPGRHWAPDAVAAAGRFLRRAAATLLGGAG